MMQSGLKCILIGYTERELVHRNVVLEVTLDAASYIHYDG